MVIMEFDWVIGIIFESVVTLRSCCLNELVLVMLYEEVEVFFLEWVWSLDEV